MNRRNHETCTIVKKNDVSTNEGGTKIPLFALNFGSIHVLTWIFVQNMWSQKEIFSYEKIKLKEGWIWSCLLNKS
jgi:hypothetical protein